MTVAAHSRFVVVKFEETWQAHEPREHDPHYHLFAQAKARLKRQGLLRCAVDARAHSRMLELHHSKIEFAHAGDVDVAKFNRAYGLHLDDEGFARYVEQEGNLEVLCAFHHRGAEGIHHLSEPLWNVVRVKRDGLRPVIAIADSEIPVDKSTRATPD